MTSSAALAKAALRRFAATKDSDDEEDEVDHHSQNLLPLTSAQKYEFKMAYRAVAGTDRSIPIDKVYDVYQAMGYTFQEDDIKGMLQDLYADETDGYSVEILLEAFERWMSAQFKPSELTAMFLMLASENRIDSEFPHHLAVSSLPEDHRGICIKDTMVNCVNKVLNKTGEPGDCATQEDGVGLANEISSTGEDHISFFDFVNIFRM